MKRIAAGNPRIGFVGLGRMGLPICAALAGAGYQVTVTDVRAGAQADAVSCGAAWRDTPAQAAAAADVLVTVLPGADEVRAVILGEAGALEAMTAGTTWIDMTSCSPSAVRPVRERVIAAGVEVLEAPVGGGVQAARKRRLQLFVGGTAGLMERHRGLLEVVADPERIVHVGGHGAGYTAKLLVNLLWFGQAIATAEALLLGQRASIFRCCRRHSVAAPRPAHSSAAM